jgi:hypothetical protein
MVLILRATLAADITAKRHQPTKKAMRGRIPGGLFSLARPSAAGLSMSAGRKGRSPDQIRKDRAEIANLYLKGLSQADIAAKLGLSRQQIGYDLKAVRKEWLRSSVMAFNQRKAEELARINRVESEYLAAWEKSKNGRETTTTEQMTTPQGDRTKAAIRKEDEYGDPRYMEGVRWCIQKRCELLGLDDPQRVHLTREETLRLHIDVFQEIDQYADVLYARREQRGLLASPVPGDGAEEPVDQAPTNGQAS